MDFARKQLEKYGWTDGKGLGKNESGISQALKPKLKRSMTGVGHDAASDFTEHWWSALYDKAASNIQVKEKDGTTEKIKTKDDSGFEITNSTWKLKRKKSKMSESKPREQYEDNVPRAENFFVRTAVLGSGGVKTERVRDSESESEEDQEKKDAFKMTDEELFAACEGRTAHKGARHGLKALGKLARIEQQEKLLLQQSRFNEYSHASRRTETEIDEQLVDVAIVNCDFVQPVLKKRNKKKHCLKKGIFEREETDTKQQLDDNEMNDAVNTQFAALLTDEPLIRKVKKKKWNTIDDEMNCEIMKNSEEFDLENDVLINKRPDHISEIDVAGNNNLADVAEATLTRKVKKNKVNTIDDEMQGDIMKNTNELYSENDVLISNKNQNKRKYLEGENCGMDVNNVNTHKSRKKNKKYV